MKTVMRSQTDSNFKILELIKLYVRGGQVPHTCKKINRFFLYIYIKHINMKMGTFHLQ